MIHTKIRPAVSAAVVALLLLGHLALTVAYSALNPLGEAPDEADHWAYVVYLARERRLPVGPEMTQAKHPPLYYATAAAVASLSQPGFEFLRGNPDVRLDPRNDPEAGGPGFFVHTASESWPWQDGPLAFHLARLWSAVLSSCAAWAAWGLARTAFPGRSGVAFAALGLVAFWPEFAFLGGSVNNDVPAALMGTLALWGGLAIYQAGGRFRAGWWTPLALGLGLWVKVSTVGTWPAVAAAVALGIWRSQPAGRADIRAAPAARPLRQAQGRLFAGFSPQRFSQGQSAQGDSSAGSQKLHFRLLRGAVALALVFIPAMAIAAPWFVRNWTLYGDPLGMAMARQTVDLRTAPWTWNDTLWLLRGWFYSFWGKFGGAGHIPFPDWAYVLFGAALVAACAGLIFWLVHRPPATESAAGGVLALALLGTMLVIWQYSLVALGTDQGRLLYPALGAVVGLLAVGLLAWIPRRWDSPAVVGIIALVLGVGVYGLAGVVRPAFAPPPAAQPGQWQQQPATEWVTFGEIVLIQWDLRGQDPVLYWAAPQRPGRDWRVVLRVVAEDGTLVWEWKRSPGAGRLSTDRWPAEFVMRDVYRVRWPDWAGPTRYRVEVGAYPFGEDLVLPTRRGQPATAGRHPYVFLGWLTR